MNSTEFAREIDRASRRLVELRRASRTAGPEWIDTALAELGSAVEELKVAEEELVSQNEELAAANAESEHQRHHYRDLFMSSPDGQVLTDLRGVILEANRAAAELFAHPPAGLVGKPLQLLVASEDRDRFVGWIEDLRDASHDASVCAACGGSAQYQVRRVGGSGPLRPCEVTAAPLADRRGRIDSIRWTLRDASERELAADARRLREEAQRKDQFLAVLCHELRNPLAAITLAADILVARGGDGERKRWAAEVVKRHADQLRRLVEDLLDTSRMSRGAIVLEPSDVDVGKVVTAAIESCEPIVKGKGHQISLSLPEAPVLLRGDRVRLTQIVVNLVDNAAKYTPSGGRIEISVERQAGTAVIAVSDCGIGIATDMLEHIFGAYHQVEGAGPPGDRGLGLGLALVRELVSLHGGRVSAASDGEGKGATFTVELPVDAALPDRSAGPTARAEVQAAQGATPHHILVVDDNVDAGELLADTLRRAGYVVELVFDGGGALAAARERRCQVALVDLGLPDIDGIEVGRALRQALPSVRLVAVTGYSDGASREKAKAAGFDRFLVKPLEGRSVAAAVAELIAGETTSE